MSTETAPEDDAAGAAALGPTHDGPIAVTQDLSTATPAVHAPLQDNTAGRPSAVALSTLERWGVGGLSLTQAAVFAWGHALPWDKAGGFVVACSLLTLAHSATAVACAAPRVPAVWRLRLWAAASLASALFLAWATWAIATSTVYLSRLYGGLGRGLGGALVAIWGLVALVTLPALVWGLCRSRPAWRGIGRPVAAVTTVAALATGFDLTCSLRAATPEHAAAESETQAWSELLAGPLAAAVRAVNRDVVDGQTGFVPLDHELVSQCPTAVSGDLPALAVAHYVGRDGKPKASCVEATSLAELATRLEQTLLDRAGPGPVLVDRLTETRRLDGAPRWVAALNLRPGLDGACLGQTCYAPWQLVAQNRFVTHSPVPFLGDLKFGASTFAIALSLADKRRRAALAHSDTAPPELRSWASQSAVLSPQGAVTSLTRSHPDHRELTPEEVRRASVQFEAHILAAQQPSGQFRYTLDPFTQHEENRELNLARQAGTVFALCDVGSGGPEVTAAARLGLQLLLAHRLEKGPLWALAGSPKARTVRLGESALPLVALLTCRARVGDEFDAAIVHLSQFLLAMQRTNGSFVSDYDWLRQKPLRTPEALYAPGQALFALTLLERLVAEHPELANLGDVAVLGAAIQRGMNHVAHEHWSMPMYPFFFVEENWNCLAARAALTRQRNADYERFCLDYVASKARLILAPDSDVAPEFVGGFGFGNVIPPHNTGAAGFGEAVAAAIAVRRARNEDATSETQVLTHILGFVLRQQWTAATCVACTPLAVGSLSEGMNSPITRIDFGQHAWAALTNGARALGLVTTAS